MKRSYWFSIILIMAAGASVWAGPTMYSGSLTSADGGILGSGGWVSDPDYAVTFSWTVTQNDNLTWHYHYELNSTGLQGELSHLVIETSLTFTRDVIFNDDPSVEADSPKWHTVNNGNPDIPADVFGIKFEDVSGAAVTVDFDSPRNPVWGDFFGKSGRVAGQVWNAGFTASDFDPLDAARGGSVAFHALVPDTTTISNPAPGAILLAGIGTALVGHLRRRRAF